MRRLYIALAVVLSLYLDSIFFARVNLAGIRPDVMLALIASLGVILGGKPAAILGACVGLIADILYSRFLGLSAIGYMVAGAVGGLFYQKYYADNIIIPALVAIVGAFLKENVMAIAARLSGAEFSYFGVLASYILPCMLFTGLLCMPFHMAMKRLLAGQIRGERGASRDQRNMGGIR